METRDLYDFDLLHIVHIKYTKNVKLLDSTHGKDCSYKNSPNSRASL